MTTKDSLPQHPKFNELAGNKTAEATQVSDQAAPETPNMVFNGNSSYENTRLNPLFTFDAMATGRANDLARAAAISVAQNPGASYNPLFVYGSVGVGKTHLVHAIGNEALRHNPGLAVRYLYAEDYFSDVIRAYQQKSFDHFQRYYRSLDLLIIDDIQSLGIGQKERTRDEFFHAFNALTGQKKQIVIACDTCPKGIQGLDARLISRLGGGLSVQIEPPELDMRIGILNKMTEIEQTQLPDDVAFLIANIFCSDIRELEGAFKKLVAYARVHEREITLEIAREALRDQLVR